MSGPSKRARLLYHSEISEIIFDTDSDEAEVYSHDSSVECDYDSAAGVSQPQLFQQTASCHESSSSVSSSASDEEDVDESGPGEQTEQPVTLQWTRSSCPQTSVVYTYTGGPRGKEHNEASHINDGSNPLSVFLLYFAEIIALLVAETNRYYHDNTDSLDEGPSPEPDNTDGPLREGQTNRLLGNSGPVIHTFLRHYDETGPISSHP
jgi:hypothetical protein